MERYFLSNNTAYGFYSNYEYELKDMDKVILIKGGPGTGKSSILKRIATLAKARGYEYELWYCSGDPRSLDGVMIKQLKTAIIDATAPHAIGADLPIIRDKIYDLANSLDYDKIIQYKDIIIKGINDKKQCYANAYRHLKCALCHLNNQLDIEDKRVNKSELRTYASVLAKDLRQKRNSINEGRRLFSKAICASGESEYFDHLKGKRTYIVEGLKRSKQIFFDIIKELGGADVYILNPLNPHIVDGIIVNDVAVVDDNCNCDLDNCDRIDLGVYEKDGESADREQKDVEIQTAFAKEWLNKAREYHLKLEEYFISAMDFKNNDSMLKDIISDVFDRADTQNAK